MKIRIICSCIAVVVAFICITLAAFYFEKIGVLLFYILPFIMSFSISDSEEGDAECQ